MGPVRQPFCACSTNVITSFSVFFGRSVVFSTSATACFSSSPHLPVLIQVSTTRSVAPIDDNSGRNSSVKRLMADGIFAVLVVWCCSPTASTRGFVANKTPKTSAASLAGTTRGYVSSARAGAESNRVTMIGSFFIRRPYWGSLRRPRLLAPVDHALARANVDTFHAASPRVLWLL